MIDSHSHLEMLKDLPAALENARQAGVRQMISIGIDLASSRKASVLAKTYDHVFHTVGLHPHDAKKSAGKNFWKDFEELVKARPPVAIGECGLDYFRNLSAAPQQREAFARQIEIAIKNNLPLVIHDREAHKETVAIMRDNQAQKAGGVLHCFSGNLDMALEVVDMGFHLGIPGVITYKKNQELRELVKQVPRERLLLETDCPFLSPEPMRGKKNQPAFMRYTASALAQALDISLQEAIRLTSANTRRLFNLPAN